jgi:hypothetical protein
LGRHDRDRGGDRRRGWPRIEQRSVGLAGDQCLAAGPLRSAIRAPEDYLSERAETQFQSLQRTYRTLETVWLLSGQKCSSEVDTFRSRGLMTCASLREALQTGEAGGKP